MKLITFLLIATFGTGCSTTFKRQPKTEARLYERAREEAQASGLAIGHTRQDISAALALSPSNAPLVQAVRSSALAAKLADSTSALLGPPAIRQSDRVEALLSTNAAMQTQAQARELSRDAATAKDMAAIRAQESVLIEKGKLYEIEQNKSIVRRVWGWAIGTLGIGGIVALCILFPAAIPMIGRIVGWLVSKIPKLSSWLGVVGVRSYQRCVTAIQEIKQQAALSGQSDAENLARRVAAENTGKDAGLVAHVKSTLDYDNATRKD